MGRTAARKRPLQERLSRYDAIARRGVSGWTDGIDAKSAPVTEPHELLLHLHGASGDGARLGPHAVEREHVLA